MAQVTLFISCVSNEFAHYRDAMRKDFARPNLTAKIQEDFYAGGMPTLQKLDEYIRNCDAVIHLCGDMTGSMANPVSLEYIQATYPDFTTRFPRLVPVISGQQQLSYTQWEAWLIAYHKKKLLIARPTEQARRHSAYQLDAGQQQHQEQHIKWLKSYNYHVEIEFSTEDELVKKLYQSSLLELFAKLSKTKPNNLPYHSIGALFKGRDKEMNKLFNELTAVHSRPAAIIGNAIHGLGGIGKTRLAVEYAWRHKEDYSALLFVAADTPEKLFSSIASLSGKTVLDLPEQDVQEEQVRYEAVISWLQQFPGWLLILDNADTKAAAERVEILFGKDLKEGHVLITTRRTNWSSQVSPLLLDVLDETAAASFLLQRTDGKRRKTAEDEKLALLISADLGYLALALEQAGAYISARRLTLTQYRNVWQTKHEEVLQWYDAQLMQYPSSVAVTWQTSVEQLTTDARLLLDRLAWLAPDPIPESLMDTKATEEDSFDYYAALAELSDYSLVSRSDDQPVFTVHRLVQDVTRRKQDKEKAKEIVTACLEWINNAFVGNPLDVRSWPILEPLMPHALELTSESKLRHDNINAESRLMNELGLIYSSKAQYQQAELLKRRALQMDEQSYGKDHPKVAIRLNNLATLLKATNRLQEAEPLMRRALQIDEQSYGKDHPDVARDLNNLAQLLQATNRLQEAEPLMRQALQIDEQSYGKDHPKVARDLNNLAQLLKVTNRLQEAEPLMRRAFLIFLASYAFDHPNTQTVGNNYVFLLQAMNMSDEEIMTIFST